MMPKETEDEHEISKAPIDDDRKYQDADTDSMGSQRVFKKTSPNSMLTLYLGSREIISRCGNVEPLRGVLYVDPKFIIGRRLCAQLTLTFRYGREDEEVMGLKFCNEAVIAIKQIWPKIETTPGEELSSLQEALMERLGIGAHAFSIEVGTIAPPSVQLIPAKRYNGAPIGTSYDIRVYIADQPDEKLQRRSTVRLGILLIHKITTESKCCYQTVIPSPVVVSSSIPKYLRLRLSPKALKLSNKLCSSSISNRNDGKDVGGSTTSKAISSVQVDKDSCNLTVNGEGSQGCVDKPFLWADGRVCLRASLNKLAYGHGEDVIITIDVKNDSRKIVRKIRIFAVQHVDVCMFSNGKFKNVVADINITKPILSGASLHETFTIIPTRGPTKNWIAVEGSLFNSSTVDSATCNLNAKIASSAPRGPQTVDERNVFAIYVSYYVKVKLTLSGMGSDLSLKLPFVLGHLDDNDENDDKDRSTANNEIGCSKIVEEQYDHSSEKETVIQVCEKCNNSRETIINDNDKGNTSYRKSEPSKLNFNNCATDTEIIVNVIKAQIHRPDNSSDANEISK